MLAIVGAIAWFLLVLFSYIALGPDRLSGRGQILSGVAVGVLCVSVMAPFALTASTVLTGKETANAIFESTSSNPTAVPVKHEDPWGGRKRVNFLLVGGDGAGKPGGRADRQHDHGQRARRDRQHRHVQPSPQPPARPLPAQHRARQEVPQRLHARAAQRRPAQRGLWQYAEDHPS
ncbi:hypothetical protein GCM10018952_28230 [Streptosporangium vulgare]